MISTKRFDAVDEALRIAEETTKEYNGVLYERGDFFRRNEL